MIDKLKQTFIGIPLSLKEKLLNLPDITPNPKGKGSGHSSEEVAKR